MKTCPNCRMELADDARFCDNCGSVQEAPKEAPQAAEQFCFACGSKIPEGTMFCPECGASQAKDSAPKAAPVNPTPKAPKEKKAVKIPTKAIVLGLAAVAVVALVILLFSLLGGGSGKPYTFYIKEGEIQYNTFSKDGAVEVTDKLAKDASEQELAYGDYPVCVRDNGSLVFFPDRMESKSGLREETTEVSEDDGDVHFTKPYYSESYTLYYRNMKKLEKSEAEKIASDVVEYEVNDDGSCLIYLTDKCDLYMTDLKEDEKVGSDVIDYQISEDMSRILYHDVDGDLYVWYDGEETKLNSDVEYIEETNEDLTMVYYLKDGTLYKHDVKEDEKEKIASDAWGIDKMYDDGTFYYLVEEEVEMSYGDLIEYDLKNVPEDYPDRDDYDSDEDYEEAYALYEADYIYQYMAEEGMTMLYEYVLYYYDGKDSVEITDGIESVADTLYSMNEKVVVVNASMVFDGAIVKMSEIAENLEDIDALMEEKEAEYAKTYVVFGTELVETEEIDSSELVRVAREGDKIYFMTDVDEDDEHGDLMCVELKNKKVGKAEVYDSDVYAGYIYMYDGGDISYYKDVDWEDDLGEWYMSGKKVDSDVGLGETYNQAEGEGFLYYADWDCDDLIGTLKLYKNGKITEIADDVWNYRNIGDGNLLYLTDYDTDDDVGTLCLYKNGKSEEIADDVYEYQYIYGDEILYLSDYDKDDYVGTLYRWNKGKNVELDDDVVKVLYVDDSRK